MLKDKNIEDSFMDVEENPINEAEVLLEMKKKGFKRKNPQVEPDSKERKINYERIDMK